MLYCSGNLVAMFTPKVLSSAEPRTIRGSAKAYFSGQIAAPLSWIGALRLFFNSLKMLANRRTALSIRGCFSFLCALLRCGARSARRDVNNGKQLEKFVELQPSTNFSF